jgi:hypothetical protein
MRTRRALRAPLAALGAAGLALGAGGLPALAATSTLPGGTSISVTVDAPANAAVVPFGQPIPASGTATIGTQAPVAPNTTVIYHLDVSGSTVNPTNTITPAQAAACGDANHDGATGTTLDCEVASLKNVNDQAVGAGTVARVGVVGVGGGSGTSADAVVGDVAAGGGGARPPTRAGIVVTIRVSHTEGTVNAPRAFDLVPATDGYFEALGARIVTGRVFTAADALSPDPICVMSESALKHLALVTDTAVGRVLNLSTPTAAGPRVKPRIVGVIRDVRYSGLDAAAHGGIYILWRQLPRGAAFLIARTIGDPSAVASAITRLVREADPTLPSGSAMTLPAVVDRALAPRSARFGLVGVFAVGAALLGIVGLSGALIRSVVERQRELAIRSAVGATPRRLLADVIRHGAWLAVTGVAIGVSISALFARAIASILYGVAPRDPLTYVATSASVLLLALAACYWPARRAASTDPVILLRSE